MDKTFSFSDLLEDSIDPISFALRRTRARVSRGQTTSVRNVCVTLRYSYRYSTLYR